jgi:hypothetical protein
MKVYSGCRGIVPLIRNFNTGWRQVVIIPSRPLYPRERTLYPLYRRMCGSQSLAGCFGQAKTLFPRSEYEPWLVQPLAWSPHRLRYEIK